MAYSLGMVLKEQQQQPQKQQQQQQPQKQHATAVHEKKPYAIGNSKAPLALAFGVKQAKSHQCPFHPLPRLELALGA